MTILESRKLAKHVANVVLLILREAGATKDDMPTLVGTICDNLKKGIKDNDE